MKQLSIPICALIAMAVVVTSPQAKPVRKNPHTFHSINGYRDNRAVERASGWLASAVADTFLLGEYTFDTPGPDAQGWFPVDRTVDPDTFFHVASAVELNGGTFGRLLPLEGAKSLWCGVPVGYPSETCGYAAPPGYGNNWSQAFSSQPLSVIGDVTITFVGMFDSEPGYDFNALHYLDKDDNWVTLLDTTLVGVTLRPSYTIPTARHDGSIRFAFTFRSDGAFSGEDGLWPTDGAVILDSLVIEDGGGIINFQDFESEPDGAHTTGDGTWQAYVRPGFGDFAAMFPGTAMLQDGACQTNISTLWAFVSGSTADYGCGGHPEQPAIPYSFQVSDEFGPAVMFIRNHIFSPVLDVTQDMFGNPIPPNVDEVIVEFDVYRDMPDPPNTVLFEVGARSYVGGCATRWRIDGGVGGGGAWTRTAYAFPLRAGAGGVQVSLGVTDRFWNFTSCHSHAPLYDNVKVYMVDGNGPHWNVPITMFFQDAFPGDGTTTGKVRMDVAFGQDLFGNGYDVPGDSIFVEVLRPGIGLDHHVHGDVSSGAAVYLHVKDVSPAKSGPIISGDLSRHPVVDQSGGWTVIQFDTAENPYGWGLDPDEYSVDLNDTLYTPGDTVFYYFSARDMNGETSYWSREAGGATTEARAILYPMEVTCLPANASNGATDILYIDGADGEGVQPFFESAFAQLGITPDRYDQIAPWSTFTNSLGGRKVPAAQLADYRTIIWNTGDVGDGIRGLFASDWGVDDYSLLVDFLDSRADGPGLYLSGNALAQPWEDSYDTEAYALRDNFINFTLLSSDHEAVGEPFSPPGIAAPGGCFDHAGLADTLIIFGGCDPSNTFDVLQPFGAASIEMTYSGNPAHAAVLAQATANTAGDTARVVFAGFSYDAIRDDQLNSPMDRVDHLADILAWLQNGTGAPTAITGTTPAITSLAQNYPNPFNPTTRISFTVAERGPVSLIVYNVRGQRVRTLASGTRAPGVVHTVDWDGTNDAGNHISSGIYFYRLTTAGFNATRKMVLLK